MDEKPDPPGLKAILASLGQELGRPLDALQREIESQLSDLDRPLPDTQRSHTLTMLALCEDLRKLTAECLGMPVSVAEVAPDSE